MYIYTFILVSSVLAEVNPFVGSEFSAIQVRCQLYLQRESRLHFRELEHHHSCVSLSLDLADRIYASVSGEAVSRAVVGSAARADGWLFVRRQKHLAC